MVLQGGEVGLGWVGVWGVKGSKVRPHTSEVYKDREFYLQQFEVTQVALLPVIEEHKVKGLDPKCLSHLGDQVT